MFWAPENDSGKFLACNVCNRNPENIKLFLALFVRIWLDKFPGSKLPHFSYILLTPSFFDDLEDYTLLALRILQIFSKLDIFIRGLSVSEWDVTLFDTIYKLPRSDLHWIENEE